MLRGNQINQREDLLFSNGVNSAGVFYAERVSHELNSAGKKLNGNKVDLIII
jgi:hypothetical protein